MAYAHCQLAYYIFREIVAHLPKILPHFRGEPLQICLVNAQLLRHTFDQYFGWRGLYRCIGTSVF